jgi:anti-sigma factor RsiW
MPVTCRKYRASVAAELDGERPGLSVEQRKAHARRCPECAAEQRRLLALRGTLQTWPEAEAPQGLAERALAQCVLTARPRRGRAGWWSVAGAVMAACAAVAFWERPMPAPVPPPRPAFSADEAYALEALSRAGARVASEWERTRHVLERTVELRELRETRL